MMHITGGTSALLLGMLALITKKGQRLHKIAGQGYLMGMLLAVVCAFVMCVMKPNAFLLSIAVFTLYMMFTGWRSIHSRLFEAKWFDRMMSVAALFTGIWMITQLEVVMMIFGGITALMALQDGVLFYKSRSKQPKKLSWLQMHIGRMVGSYIATVTAFLVVNVQIKPYWLPWLTPTVFGSIAIAYFINRYTITSKVK
jgi:uncharacterized membrane protein